MKSNFLNPFFTFCHTPKAWGVYFQDSASPQTEALLELHDNIMFYLVIVSFGVSWILISIVKNYVNSKFSTSKQDINQPCLLVSILTIIPALILILIAFPSFKLLYLMDEVTDPSLTVYVQGHQWYWSYEYLDFLYEENEDLVLDSYLVHESDLNSGVLKMNHRAIAPKINDASAASSSTNNNPGGDGPSRDPDKKFNYKLFADLLKSKCEYAILERNASAGPGVTPSKIVTLEDIGIDINSPEYISLKIFTDNYKGDNRFVKYFCTRLSVIVGVNPFKQHLGRNIPIYSLVNNTVGTGSNILDAIREASD